MNNTQHQRSRIRNSTLQFLFYLGFGVVGIGLFAGGWKSLDVSREYARLRERVSQLADSQKPITNDDAQFLYSSKTTPEGSPEWLDIFSLVNSPEYMELERQLPFPRSKGLLVVPDRDQPWNDASVAQFLQQNQAILRKLAIAASGRRPVFFPINFDGLKTNSTSVKGLQFSSNLLKLKASIAIRHGEGQEAYRSILGLLGVSIVGSKEPLVASQLTSIAIELEALDVIRNALKAEFFAEDQLKELLNIVSTRPPVENGWVQMIQGERALLIASWEEARREKGFMGYFHSEFENQIHVLDRLDRLESSKPDDGVTFMTELNRIQSEAKSASVQSRTPTKDRSHFDSLITLAQSGSDFVDLKMMRDLSALALSIRLHRLRHSEFPESISQLNEFGVDISKFVPLGPKPFGYRRLEGSKAGCVLWGFSIMSHIQTPDEPPTFSEQKNGNQGWAWEMR